MARYFFDVPENLMYKMSLPVGGQPAGNAGIRSGRVGLNLM